tara:strand:- start:16974 stop:17288 length:315 start_codon:yes stop_codon:yes gene_type:complete
MSYLDHKRRIESAIDNGARTLKQIIAAERICKKTIKLTRAHFPDLNVKLARLHNMRLDERIEARREQVERITAMRANGFSCEEACKREGMNEVTYRKYRDMMTG